MTKYKRGHCFSIYPYVNQFKVKSYDDTDGLYIATMENDNPEFTFYFTEKEIDEGRRKKYEYSNR